MKNRKNLNDLINTDIGRIILKKNHMIIPQRQQYCLNLKN